MRDLAQAGTRETHRRTEDDAERVLEHGDNVVAETGTGNLGSTLSLPLDPCVGIPPRGSEDEKLVRCPRAVPPSLRFGTITSSQMSGHRGKHRLRRFPNVRKTPPSRRVEDGWDRTRPRGYPWSPERTSG